MRVLITYDLKSDHKTVKDTLKTKGWKETIVGSNGVKCHLPNTSLWKDNISASDARTEIQSVTSRTNLERLICVEFTSWAGIEGSEF